MRSCFFLCFVAVLLSCSRLATRETQADVTIQNADSFSESITTTITDTTTAFYADTFHVGYVGTFPETREYYIDLYFRKKWVETNDFLDSLIFDESEITRKQLPMPVAQELLVMENLADIIIFNSKHQIVTRAHLEG